MKFLTILYLLGLPGVARASQLDARQVTPSGNSSVTLPSQSPSTSPDSSSSSSQIESTAPSLVATSTTTSATSLATSTEVTTSSSQSKQERGPQDPDVTPPGPPPEFAPTFLTSVETTPPGETLATLASTSTSVIIQSTTGTTTLAFSSPTIIASPEISSAQPTTIATTKTNSPPVVSSPSTTLITSRISSSVISSSLSSPIETSGITTSTTSNSEAISSPTETATSTMSSPTPTPSSVSSSSEGNSTSILTIVLSTILSVVGVILIAAAAYLCTGDRRKRLPMFMIKRGITPIGDDEIATWKSNRSAEKVTDRYTTRPSHSQNPSVATSTRRAPSVIQYHTGGRQSFEVASPRSFIGDGKYSFDLPQAPGAVFARAPNARSGLTDETVPGDDPFLPSPKRNPSRLHKLPPGSPSLHGRMKGSRSSSLRSYAEAAWRDGLEQGSSPRVSSDTHSRNHNRIYSNSSIPPPPRLSFGDNDQLTGLSPPPSRRNDSTIGLAVG